MILNLTITNACQNRAYFDVSVLNSFAPRMTADPPLTSITTDMKGGKAKSRESFMWTWNLQPIGLLGDWPASLPPSTVSCTAQPWASSGARFQSVVMYVPVWIEIYASAWRATQSTSAARRSTFWIIFIRHYYSCFIQYLGRVYVLYSLFLLFFVCEQRWKSSQTSPLLFLPVSCYALCAENWCLRQQFSSCTWNRESIKRAGSN